MPEQTDTARSASEDATIERLRRDLGEQRLRKARDQAHQAVASMDLVFTALSDLADADEVTGKVFVANEAVRLVRDRVAQLEKRFTTNGGPLVRRIVADYEHLCRSRKG